MDNHWLHQTLEKIQEKDRREGSHSLSWEEKHFLEILDKISERGFDSLRPPEREFIESFAQAYSGSARAIPIQKSKKVKEEEGLVQYIPWVVVPILLILVFALFVLPKIRDSLHYAHLPENYSRMDTEHFRVYYPEKNKQKALEVTKIAEGFLQKVSKNYWEVLGDLTPPSYKTSMALFLSHEEFSRYAYGETKDAFINNGGYFSPVTGDIALTITGDSERALRGTRHEVAHYIFSRGGGALGSGLAPWLAEGLAVFFEKASLEDPFFPVDVYPREGIFAASQKDILPLPEIVDFNQKDFSQRGNRTVYGYSYLLTYFLWKRDGKTFWKYVRKARWGKDKKYQQFLETFGPEKELLDDWKAFMKAVQDRFAELKKMEKQKK